MRAALAALVTLLVAQTPPSPSPTSSPTAVPSGPVYVGNPAVRFSIESRPLGFTPDGMAKWLVIAHFYDAENQETKILANSDLDWKTDRGHVQWESRMRYGSPAANVTTDRDGPITFKVHANMPQLGDVRVSTNTRDWKQPRIVAQALGPHLVQIGWFPRATQPVRITRIDGNGRRAQLATLTAGTSTYRDASVTPSRHYRYIITTHGTSVKLPLVNTPLDAPATTLSMASGKALYLWYSLNPIDDNYVGKLDPQAIVDQAVKAGLHYVQLRTAYGAFWQLPPDAKPTIDAIIDGLAAHGILTMGWTVPREATFDDIATSMRTIYYKTPHGTGLAGLAIDLERGSDFMGSDPHGNDALWQYLRYLREAVGPSYLLVATVEDPYLEHITNKDYPYRKIAPYPSALNPMTYWRMMRKHPTDPGKVHILLKASYEKLLAQTGRKLPIVIGGQTSPEVRNGPPPADEITASLDEAKSLGALGEIFFDWTGTQPYQWDALAAYQW